MTSIHMLKTCYSSVPKPLESYLVIALEREISLHTGKELMFQLAHIQPFKQPFTKNKLFKIYFGNKRCRLRLHLCLRSFLSNLGKYLEPHNKARAESFRPCKKYDKGNLKRYDTYQLYLLHSNCTNKCFSDSSESALPGFFKYIFGGLPTSLRKVIAKMYLITGWFSSLLPVLSSVQKAYIQGHVSVYFRQ